MYKINDHYVDKHYLNSITKWLLVTNPIYWPSLRLEFHINLKKKAKNVFHINVTCYHFLMEKKKKKLNTTQHQKVKTAPKENWDLVSQ